MLQVQIFRCAQWSSLEIPEGCLPSPLYVLKQYTMHTHLSEIKCIKVSLFFFSKDLKVAKSLQYRRQPSNQLLSLSKAHRTHSQEEAEDWNPVISGRKNKHADCSQYTTRNSIPRTSRMVQWGNTILLLKLLTSLTAHSEHTWALRGRSHGQIDDWHQLLSLNVPALRLGKSEWRNKAWGT